MLSVRDLDVSYGGALRALRGVSVDVPERGVVAVLGSNGAGKTTLLRAVSGNLRGVSGAIDGGSITFDGRQLNGRPPAEIEGVREFGVLGDPWTQCCARCMPELEEPGPASGLGLLRVYRHGLVIPAPRMGDMIRAPADRAPGAPVHEVED